MCIQMMRPAKIHHQRVAFLRYATPLAFATMIVMAAFADTRMNSERIIRASGVMAKFGVVGNLVQAADEADRAELASLAADLGVKFDIETIPWASWEKDGKGIIDDKERTNFEDAIRRTKSYGIGMVGYVSETPFWAGYRYGPPSNLQDYADFVSYIVQTYKNDIKYWQIWNEPNLPSSWNGDEATFVQMLKLAYTAAKRADPSCKVLLAGTSGADSDWIQRAYDLGGKDYFDIVSIHPYTYPELGVDTLVAKCESVRQVMMRNNDSEKTIWITEIGVDNGEFFDHPNTVSEEERASWLRGVCEKIAGLAYVERLFWYVLRDYSSTLDFGLVNQDFSKDTIYYAYKDFLMSK